MECNKDEAVRAKEIAEQKFTKKDIAGAQKFALKAQNLFPGLDGLSQFLEVVNVYVAHEKKSDGEVDFYSILSVDPSADEETIRKHYRRLALALHPDKNHAVGADGAFKIISEAWSLLSDKAKRMMYDNKRAVRNASIQANQHVFPVSARNSTKANFQPAPVTPQPPKVETFWTSCNLCQIRYEYLKIYRNKSIKCPKCHQPFCAREVGAPVKDQGAQPYAPTARQAAHPGQPAGGVSKKAHAEAASSASFMKTDAVFVPDSVSTCSNADRLIKKRRTAELKPKFQGKGMINDIAAKGGSSQGNIRGNENGVLRAERVAVVGSNKPRSSTELSNLEIRNMLMKKARLEINKKLKEWSAAAASRTSSKKETEVEMKKQIIKNDPKRKKAAADVVVDSKILREQENLPVFSAPTDLESEAKSMTVPDPDFHNFDKDRAENSFDDKQVWAAYDNDDGMTRYYALIHKVLSRKPFKVQLSWLNSKSNSEFGPINWVGSGFLKTCGNFRIGRHEVNKTLNSFSHKVKWVKGAGGVVQIFPRKGDVWALYRHWSPQWNELTPDDMIHNYDMVEVLGDYTEKEGVTVAPLIKVAGFTSVFRQHMDPKHLLHIPKEEMFRFSHQVPSYLLTDQEAPNAPTGCWELDPAALPLELLRVMTDAEIESCWKVPDTSNLERTCGESKEKEKSYVVGDNSVTKGEETSRYSMSVAKQPIVTYSRKKKEQAEASTIEAKRETSSVAAKGF